ncbi:hypothetical protein OsI_38887 [Oryza sativa Indica Group]|uniref:R13L1/DRL21-like LRR repeat region domain-containing protein n=1 Tax=Oryza sativa subsp. indica TaxID=39946 RepID=A2ZM28_ORYSI|nr:hypothetical protein OsI_38887 [Oryza sativa Indica Group]
MEVALRTAGWLVGKLVDLLSAELLEALDNSYNLGANAHAIKAELLYTQGLLHKAQGRNVAHSPELAGLLLQLTHLAEDADNVLDKVDYYRIRDQVRGGRGFIRRFATHAGHSLGKCRRSLTSSLSCRDIVVATATAGPRPVEAEFFNRSVECERMKSLMAQMQPLCAKISDFLKLEVMDPKHRIAALTNTAAAFSERVTTTTSTSLEANLYGRQEEFYVATKEITGGRDGIFQKVDGVKFSHEKGREVKHTYYVMHGLLHQLALIISSRECLSIDCSNPTLVYIPPTIRHLSITIRSIGDTLGVDHYQNFKENMRNLKEQISIADLHTLMFIGECDERFSEDFKEILKEIKHVRVLRLFQTALELPRKLIHLRYLRIQASKKPMNTQLQLNRSVTQEHDQLTMGETQTPATNDPPASLPSSLPEYYHLRFLDLQDWMGMPEVPEGMHISRLIHLHHFLATKKLQSSVAKVGKLKLLQELAMFQVKRTDRDGFELQQLGELRDLGGALTISNLHKVKTTAEAEKAKLKLKRNLVRLKLVWDEAGNEQTKEEANSIEGLQPPANLRELCIKNHKGNTCPSWFHSTNSFKALEVLHLHGVSWNTLPPFGQIPYLRKLKLENIAIENFEARAESLENLRSIEFIGMLSMTTWESTNLFTQLEQLKVSNCPVLKELPLSQNLQLSQTPTQQDFHPVQQILAVMFQRYFQAFPVQQKCSMPNLHELVVQDCPQLSLPLMPYTPMLQLVEVATRQYILLYNKYTLEIRGVDNNLCDLGNLDNVLAFHDMKWLVRVTIKVCSYVPLGILQKLTSLEALTFEDCSSLSSGRGENAVIKISIKHLVLRNCNITGKELSKILACCPCLSHLEMEDCNGITGLCMQQSVREMDNDGNDVGVLQFPSKFTSTLSRLGIFSRNDITLNVNREVLGKLKSLQWLQLGGCDLSCAAMQAVNDDHPLENHLKVLRVYGYGMPVLAQDWLMTRMARTVVAGSFQLEELDIGSISGVLDVQICNHHFSTSLRRLTFRNDKLLQSFTEDQETALRKFTSLQELVFYGCDRLQSLPSSLRTLPSLKRLEVSYRQLQGEKVITRQDSRCEALNMTQAHSVQIFVLAKGICQSQRDNIECTFNKKNCLEACNGSTYMG